MTTFEYHPPTEKNRGPTGGDRAKNRVRMGKGREATRTMRGKWRSDSGAGEIQKRPDNDPAGVAGGALFAARLMRPRERACERRRGPRARS
ncbi:hypothetical protein [Burkholderia territorii]|uniref:hypothetical protein n=1 Tax=Burkholderia territorii TaxID=1503055 RepID=UPI0012DB107A|nr:hypothetical protein [Burkholderia territorii]